MLELFKIYVVFNCGWGATYIHESDNNTGSCGAGVRSSCKLSAIGAKN